MLWKVYFAYPTRFSATILGVKLMSCSESFLINRVSKIYEKVQRSLKRFKSYFDFPPQKMKIPSCIVYTYNHLQVGFWIVNMHLASTFVFCTYAITYNTNICN